MSAVDVVKKVAEENKVSPEELAQLYINKYGGVKSE